MNKLFAAVCIAAAVLLLTACGEPTEATPAPTVTVTVTPEPTETPTAVPSPKDREVSAGKKKDFLETLRGVEPKFKAAEDSDLIELGLTICQALDIGANEATLNKHFAEKLGVMETSYLISGATMYLCPEYFYP